MPSNAFCSVWLGLPAPGCTTRPTGLSTTKTSLSRCSRVSGMFSPSTSGRGTSGVMRTLIREPAFTTSRGLQGKLPTNTWPASIHPLMRVRECCGIICASALSRRWPASS